MGDLTILQLSMVEGRQWIRELGSDREVGVERGGHGEEGQGKRLYKGRVTWRKLGEEGKGRERGRK